MSDGTAIEWTDATWNIVNGCTVHSPGCANCYAMQLAATRLKNIPSRVGLARMHNGHAQWTGEVRFNEAVLLDPLKWRRPRRIFVCAHGDLFHEKVPDEWIDRVFAVMALCPQHSFQVLTKRAERMRKYISRLADSLARWRRLGDAIAGEIGNDAYDTAGECFWPIANVWLGVSVEDQARADERIPDLLETPAAVRWLSCEPLLGPLDLGEWFVCPNWSDDIPMDMTTGLRECCAKCDFTGIGGFSGLPIVDWVVAGGESGRDARPMHPAWARSLRDQCAAAGVPFLFKQWGSWGETYSPDRDGPTHFVMPDGKSDIIESGMTWPRGAAAMRSMDKRRAGRLLDGQQHDAFPA